MDPITIAGIATGLISLVDKFVGSKVEKERLKTLILEAQQKGNFDIAMKEMDIVFAQIQANEVQAASPNLFVSGPRPYAMWVCNFALTFGAIIQIVIPAIMVIVATYVDGDFSRSQKAISQLNSISIEFYVVMLCNLLGLGFIEMGKAWRAGKQVK